MAFLVWNNETDSNNSLANVNTVYDVTISTSSGYVMATWDKSTKSISEDKWGWNKPEARLGKTLEELMAVLVSGYTELSERPANWVSAAE